MSISKRRRRARNRRIEKWRKRARKIQARYNRELQYSELLDQFHTYINEEYQRGCITLYRWVHDLFTADDFKPQIFQSFSDRDISDVYIPTPIENVKRIKKYVDYFTLSHFLSERQAVEKYNSIIEKLATGPHPETVDKFMNEKGTYIQKCNYGEDDILYDTPNDEGHVNALLCRGFDPERVIDTTYTPIKIV